MVHHSTGITHWCWGIWNPWIGASGWKAVPHNSHQSITFKQTPSCHMNTLHMIMGQPAWCLVDNWINVTPNTKNNLNYDLCNILLVLQLIMLWTQVRHCVQYHVLTGVCLWAFCSHIIWNLKNTELICWIYIWPLLHWMWT